MESISRKLAVCEWKHRERPNDDRHGVHADVSGHGFEFPGKISKNLRIVSPIVSPWTNNSVSSKIFFVGKSKKISELLVHGLTIRFRQKYFRGKISKNLRIIR